MLPWIDGFITASENEPGLSYLLFNERRYGIPKDKYPCDGEKAGKTQKW
jgi:hypothetical protein